MRTRFYDDFLLDAADEGLRQVVVLGSGLDTRAFRLPWPHGTQMFEIDQPQVLDFKNRVLVDAEIVPACRRTTVGTDLRGDWLEGLRLAGFDERLPTTWLAEGLLAYLEPSEQEAFVGRLHSASARGSCLALDRLLPTDKDGDEALRRLADRSGMSMDTMLKRTDNFSPAERLSARGWTVAEDSADAVADRYGRDLSDPFGADTDSTTPPWLATAFLCGRLGPVPGHRG